MQFDVTMTLHVQMRVDAFDEREAMDIVIADCWQSLNEQIVERHIEVIEEDAQMAQA